MIFPLILNHELAAVNLDQKIAHRIPTEGAGRHTRIRASTTLKREIHGAQSTQIDVRNPCIF